MKQPRRPSYRQFILLMERETKIRLEEKARVEVVSILADLLLEAIDAAPGEATEGISESED